MKSCQKGMLKKKEKEKNKTLSIIFQNEIADSKKMSSIIIREKSKSELDKLRNKVKNSTNN